MVTEKIHLNEHVVQKKLKELWLCGGFDPVVSQLCDVRAAFNKAIELVSVSVNQQRMMGLMEKEFSL